jgi:hypothetical protein
MTSREGATRPLAAAAGMNPHNHAVGVERRGGRGRQPLHQGQAGMGPDDVRSKYASES